MYGTDHPGSLPEPDSADYILEMSQDLNTSGVLQLPYPRNAQVSAECLLYENDTFFAATPLEYCDAHHTSPTIAIGDSMFHKLRFGDRAERGQAGKMSFGGGRISEVYSYLQESGPVRR